MATEDRVPNAPFREKVLEVMEREDISWAEVARRAGWLKGGSRSPRSGDTSYLQRLLGLREWPAQERDGHAYGAYVRDYMSYDAAVKLCDALGLDYTDMDL